MTTAVDQETRLEADDHYAVKVWLRMLTCSTLIEARIRQLLRRDFDCTLPRFDLLAQLERADGLKMNELSQRLMVTGGNVTGLADQLQDEGWLVREPVEQDRRATRLRLTPAGRQRFAGMARTHEAWVVQLLGALTRDEQRQLHALLGKLKTGLRAPPEGARRTAPRASLRPSAGAADLRTLRPRLPASARAPMRGAAPRAPLPHRKTRP